MKKIRPILLAFFITIGISGSSPHVWGSVSTATSGFDISLNPHSYKVFQIK